jgi:hypothetical protein
VASLGVLDDVVQRLLGDTIEGHVDLFGQGMEVVHVHRHRNAGAAGSGFAQLAQQVAQVGFDQGCRAELEQQGPHLGQGAPAQLAEFGQQRSALFLVGLPQLWHRFSNQAGRKEGLGDGIVQLAGQALRSSMTANFWACS